MAVSAYRVGVVAPRASFIRDAAVLGLADAFAAAGERTLILYADALPQALLPFAPGASLAAFADRRAKWDDLLSPVHYLHASLAAAPAADLARLNALDAQGASAAVNAFWRAAQRDGRHGAALAALPPGPPEGFAAALARGCDALLGLIDPAGDDPSAFVYACLRQNRALSLLLCSPPAHATKEIADGRDFALLAFGPIVLDRVLRDERAQGALTDAAFAPQRHVYAAVAKALLDKRGKG